MDPFPRAADEGRRLAVLRQYAVALVPPDPALRERPTLGLVILHGLHRTENPNVYKGGRIYDPKNGKTYDCRAIFKGDTLELRGFVLGLPFLGRTAIWSKAD